MTETLQQEKKLKEAIAEYADFPIPGIVFKDLNPLYKDKALWPMLISIMEKRVNELGAFDYIAGVEARGFILGSALALKMGCGFIPIRKKGKLPGNTMSVQYSLEYGRDVLQIQVDESLKHARILIVDDVFATGGTLKAVIELLSYVSTQQPAVSVVMDIKIADINQLNIPYAVVIA